MCAALWTDHHVSGRETSGNFSVLFGNLNEMGISLSFRCCKLGLIFLNILYMIVGLTLVVVPAYTKISSVFTSWSIVGGAIACGVFMMLMSLAGIYGTVRHHQIILFFYMAVMVIIFFILLCVSVAALAITANQQNVLLRKLWMSLSNHTKKEVQKFGNCCGFENKNITLGNEGHPSCEKLPCCQNKRSYSCVLCPTCKHYLMEDGVQAIKKAVGGIGLFFSFTLLLGLYMAIRYRHLKDPRANPSAFL